MAKVTALSPEGCQNLSKQKNLKERYAKTILRHQNFWQFYSGSDHPKLATDHVISPNIHDQSREEIKISSLNPSHFD